VIPLGKISGRAYLASPRSVTKMFAGLMSQPFSSRRRLSSVGNLVQEIRIGLRQLAKYPGLTGIAVLSLALGIGATTAVFSLINDVLLRSLSVARPGELVLFRNVQGPSGRISRAGENNSQVDPATGRESSTSFSLLTLEGFRTHHPALSTVFAFAPFNQIQVLVDGQPETEVLGQLVSGDYYGGLGVSTVLGRTLTVADDQPSAEPVAVISHRWWVRRFGSDPAVIGKTMQVNRVPVTIVGVTPPGFGGAMQIGESADVSLPLAHHARFQPDRGESRAQPWYWWIRIMGRVAPGFTAAQVRASLEPILQDTAREAWLASQSLEIAADTRMPELPTLRADPGGQGENDTRRQYARSLRVLMGLVSLVLLAACANVANLLLARDAARRREMALRLALGASRARIVRQLLAESLLLAAAGAMIGTTFAFWGRGLLVALRQFSGSPVILDRSLDPRVLAFTVSMAFATSLLFGLAPALRTTRLDLSAEFQGGTRQVGSGPASRLSQGLLVLQIALSLVLLVGTGLFARTLSNLRGVDPGFNPHRLALFRIDAQAAGYEPAQFATLFGRIQERLASLHGVRVATYSNVALLAGVRSNRSVSAPGYTPPAGVSLNINTNGLAANFLEAMEIPLLLGRGFTEHDSAESPKVVIVNQALARQVFGAESPVGRAIVFGATPTSHGTEVEIVGVARDAKYTGLRPDAPPTIYLPAAQQGDGTANFCVRVAGDPGAMFAAIRAAVREVDPTLPVTNLRTQDEQIERISAQERLFARLSGFFGVVALGLACVGLYGLMSFVVVRRTGEIGVRMALGALPLDVLRLILRDSAAIVASGILLGLAAAYGGSRLVESMLFGLSPGDPWTYASVTGLLAAVALLACLAPARRATQVDPLTALRTE
jgi:predicted permease